MKTGTNQPELKLSEVLTSIGYNGPRITDLKEVCMKTVMLQEPTSVYANIQWIGDPYNYGGNIWASIPYNTIASTTRDIALGSPGIVGIKRPGIYSLSGVVTPEKNAILVYYLNKQKWKS